MSIYESDKTKHDFIKDEHAAIEKIVKLFYNTEDDSFSTRDAFDALENAGYPVESVGRDLEMCRISVTVRAKADEPHEPDDKSIRIHYCYFF